MGIGPDAHQFLGLFPLPPGTVPCPLAEAVPAPLLKTEFSPVPEERILAFQDPASQYWHRGGEAAVGQAVTPGLWSSPWLRCARDISKDTHILLVFGDEGRVLL